MIAMVTLDEILESIDLPRGTDMGVRPCPGCTTKQRIIRGLADILATTAGESAGRAFRNPIAGELLGELAPGLIEAGALGIAKRPKVKRKASAYSKKFGKAFKKVQGKFKKQSGCWKKGGYRRCVKEAHKLAKKMR